MKRLLSLLILAFAANAGAQSTACYPGALDLVPFTKESKTVSTASVSLTAATYAPTDGPRAAAAMITVGAQPVRVWFDGTDPTSTVGHYFAANTIINVCQNTIALLRAIRDTSATGDAIFSVTYSRPPQ
jgi:hypothetical protein